MATATRYLSRTALSFTRRIPTRRKPRYPIPQHVRPFHSTLCQLREDAKEEGDPPTVTEDLHPPRDFYIRPEFQEEYNLLSPEERAEIEEHGRTLIQGLASPQFQEDLARDLRQADHQVEREVGPAPSIPKGITKAQLAQAFWAADEEDDEFTQVEDGDEWNDDDISSYAHGDLEQHREAREYARIAAWELPLLSKLAKPFQPPALTTPLRFRHTTYLGEHHPAERKISVEFCTADLLAPHGPLTAQTRTKFIKLLGVRYNPTKDLAKLSCEKFETPAQNKRYLGDLVDSLIAEAQDQTDTFADIPFDYRHVKEKTRPMFPAKWRMTETRRQQLEKQRREKQLKEEERRSQMLLVDGMRVIEGQARAEQERREALERERERDETYKAEQVAVKQARQGNLKMGRGVRR